MGCILHSILWVHCCILGTQTRSTCVHKGCYKHSIIPVCGEVLDWSARNVHHILYRMVGAQSIIISLEAVTGFRYFPKLRHQFFLAEICVYAKCYFQYDDTVDTPNCNLWEKVNKESEVDKILFANIWKISLLMKYIFILFVHVCYVYRRALRGLMHPEVCIGLDILLFPFFDVWIHQVALIKVHHLQFHTRV